MHLLRLFVVAAVLPVAFHTPLTAQADPGLLWGDRVPEGCNGDWPDRLRIVPERTGYRREGTFGEALRTFPAGTFFVDMAQPMANAAFYYLEPRSADGFVGWHVMDRALQRPGAGAGVGPAVYPVFKLQREVGCTGSGCVTAPPPSDGSR